MIRCEDCGEVFETPDTYSECIGEFWGAPAYETFGCCPFCGSSELDYDYIKEMDDFNES